MTGSSCRLGRYAVLELHEHDSAAALVLKAVCGCGMQALRTDRQLTNSGNPYDIILVDEAQVGADVALPA